MPDFFRLAQQSVDAGRTAETVEDDKINHLPKRSAYVRRLLETFGNGVKADKRFSVSFSDPAHQEADQARSVRLTIKHKQSDLSLAISAEFAAGKDTILHVGQSSAPGREPRMVPLELGGAPIGIRSHQNDLEPMRQTAFSHWLGEAMESLLEDARLIEAGSQARSRRTRAHERKAAP